MKKFSMIATLTLVGCSAFAQTSQPNPKNVSPAVQLPELTVSTELNAGNDPILFSRESLAENHTAVNAGEILKTIPGISAVNRGACALEPVVRGMGWERVVTQVDGLPLYGACPSRMDPPITLIAADSLEGMSVEKGLPSVTHGPGGTGGRVSITTNYDRGDAAGDELAGKVRVTYDDARDGLSSQLEARGGSDDFDFRSSLHFSDMDDYESASGVTVPASFSSHGVGLSLGYRPAEGQRIWASYLFKEEQDVDFPALPMDTEEVTSHIVNGGVKLAPASGLMELIEFKLGIADVDHLMSNRYKPNRKLMEARTPSAAQSFSAALSGNMRLNDDAVVILGSDAARLERDAIRTRTMVASGASLRDHIWPDVSQDNVGVFGEYNADYSDRLTVRAGARADWVASEAKAERETLKPGPKSPATAILDSYNRYNETNLSDADAEDVLGSGNLTIDWKHSEQLIWHLGVGHVQRSAAVTERYFAFAPAPGGFLVGNPDLDPEKKTQIDLGLTWKSEIAILVLTGFAAQVQDYIYQTQFARADVNGDGVVDSVRGFRNVDAELFGGELSLKLIPAAGWELPVSLACVQAENTDANRDLPEIPPLEARAALRYSAESDHAWWVETGVRLVARQDKVDEIFPEDETPGFEVFHVKAGITVLGNLDLELGVENLFDEDYHEHLNREALMPVGDLKGGDEVPEPGRFVYLSAALTL